MNINKKVLGLMCVIGIISIVFLQNQYPINSMFLNKALQVEASNDTLHNEENKLEEKNTETKKEDNTKDKEENSDDTDDVKNSDSSEEDEEKLEIDDIDNNINEEFRAAWISTVYNLDWPSQKGLTSTEQKEEFIELIDGLKDAGLNSVIVQVKPTADSFYPSEYGPWSEYLTGVQGQDPGYNPLAFMIEETHKRNMEFHAWFNPYRVSMKDNLEALSNNHPARENPDWVVSYGGKLYYNPGIPEAREFIIKSIVEVVKDYNVDGIHLDDYFYPYPEENVDFPDDDLYEEYKRSDNESKEEWRRNNINKFVENLYKSIKSEKSHVTFGVSPFGVWRNSLDDSSGSNTNAWVTSYDTLHADTKYWIEQEWLDYIAPQIYWNIGYEVAEYKTLVNWWSDLVKDRNVDLYIGQAAYKIEETDTSWGNPLEIINQIEYNRSIPEVKGSIFFRAKSILNNPLGLMDKFKNEIYK